MTPLNGSGADGRSSAIGLCKSGRGQLQWGRIMSPTDSESTTGIRPIPDEPQWAEQQHLVYLLQDQDIQCPRCGADLRGLQNNRCPGCDSELTLSLSPVKRHLGPWIASAAALSASAGLGLLFLVAVIAKGWPTPAVTNRTGWWLWVSASILYFLTSIPFAVVVFLMRRRLMRFPRRIQVLLSAILVTVSVLALIMFFLAAPRV